MNILRFLPLLLTTLRLLLAPAVLALAFFHRHRAGWVIALCIVIALLSDIFDGIIARRLGIATEFLRRYDTITDTLFYASVAWSIWILYPRAFRDNVVPLGLLILSEVLRYIFDWSKFGKAASYHTWLAKGWGLMLAIACMALMIFGTNGALLRTAILAGVLTNTEGLAISFILPKWRHDVPTIWHAWNLRKQTVDVATDLKMTNDATSRAL